MSWAAAFDYESDSENEDLRRKLEEAKRTNRAEIEDLERALATELNDIEELEKLKQLVREKRVAFANEIDELSGTENEVDFTQFKIQSLQPQNTSEFNAEMASHERTLVNFFTPLSADAELEVDKVLRGENRIEILVTHEKSNIHVTRAVLQCLSPGMCLNDKVINLYMELLKEREMREPDCHLKCHFFNTFFYKKLNQNTGYDYEATRNWTTRKKLGYSLSDCNKILVPIYQESAKHWCLAIISICDKRLEYLDSLKGGDTSVLDVLGRYIADEAKDKDDKVLDVRNWDQYFLKNIPAQLNGWDCGMFMLKYADFISRGAPLNFTQDNMEYFRRKIVWEILQSRAT